MDNGRRKGIDEEVSLTMFLLCAVIMAAILGAAYLQESCDQDCKNAGYEPRRGD